MSEKKYTEVVEAMCVLDRQKSIFYLYNDKEVKNDQ